MPKIWGNTDKGPGAGCLLISILIALSLFTAPAGARELLKLETRDLTVICDPALRDSAEEIISLYPVARAFLQSTIMWEIDFSPTVILIGDRRVFQQMAGNRLFVAYAIPERQTIVIDDTRMSQRPFSREATLKHELCHLLLERHVRRPGLPKWLNEGIAQWVSEGIPDIIAQGRGSLLPQAAMSGRLIRLDSLNASFPDDEQGIVLAYEQSRSIVDYIIANYGKNGILNILEAVRKGADFQDAVRISLMIPLPEIEERWKKDQKGLPALMSYLAVHLYTILFVTAALLTFLAYIRFVFRKRRLMEEEEAEENIP